MPIPIPDLDDRSFSDLVEEALAMIPRYAPEWTNHNASDPGITLVELLAYVTEILLYRLNRITREHRVKYLQLLQGAAAEHLQHLADPDTPVEELDQALRQAVRDLRKPERLVTAEDYESRIRDLKADGHPGLEHLARICGFSGCNLALPDEPSRSQIWPGHLSVVVLPDRQLAADALAALLAAVQDELEPRRLLTIRVHVVPPIYLSLRLQARVGPSTDSDAKALPRALIDNLRQFFDPLPGGGTDAQGWPFGRAVYLSEVFARLEAEPNVDYVESVHVTQLRTTGENASAGALGVQIGVTSTVGMDTRIGGESAGDDERLIRDSSGTLTAVALRPYELVRVELHPEDFRIE